MTATNDRPAGRWWVIAALMALVAVPAAGAVAAAESAQPTPVRYEGKWEGSLFLPFVSFDTDAPIEDSAGVDDEIRNAFGRGLSFGYNFTRSQAIEATGTWVDSDSEDQRGAVHFSVRTLYALLAYRVTWNMTPRLVPFFTAGVGHFSCRSLERNHPDYTGPMAAWGAGLRYYTGSRSSIYLYTQLSQVDLEPDDADNLTVAVGLTSHFGHRSKTKGKPAERPAGGRR